MRILFFGTSEFALEPLKALHNSHFEVVGVVTTPDKQGKRGKKLIKPPVKIVACEYSYEVYQPESLKTAEAFERIKRFNADIFVVVSYGKFLPSNIVELPKYKAVNIHPSLLPKYRGASPINYALLNGDNYTGVSIIEVTDKMDAGRVYMQWLEKINLNDDYESLHNRLSAIGSKMLICVLDSISSGNANVKSQDESMATFTKIIDKKDGAIDFQNEDASRIINKIRAYSVWPSAYFKYNNKIFKILGAEIANCANSEAGKVARVSKKELVVGCRTGCISILTIQPESKKPMNIKAFLAGYKFAEGQSIT